MLKGLFLLDDFSLIYESVYRELKSYVDVYSKPRTKEEIRENPSLLNEADVIFSGWGCPVMDEAFLMEAPNLKIVFYGAGSVKYLVTDAFWERGIKITSAYAANAQPVVEYTVSQILFSLKRGWYYVMKSKSNSSFPVKDWMPGGFRSTIGIVSLGMIGKKVCNMLKHFDVNVIAYDPYVSQDEAEKLGVQLCSLEKVFSLSDVVTLHTPWLKETEGLINGDLIQKMKFNATLINTSRGAIINEREMIKVLTDRSDIFAVLDVTYPEPPEVNSPLFQLENVILTPHIAGSLFDECQRMGEFMLEELKRYINNEPLKWEITKDKASIMG